MAELEFEPTVGAAGETRIYAEPVPEVSSTRQVGRFRTNFGIVGLIGLPLLVVCMLLAQTRSMADVITEDDSLDARLKLAKEKGFSLDPRPFYLTGIKEADNAYVPLKKYFVDSDKKIAEVSLEISNPKLMDVSPMTDDIKALVAHAKEVAARPRFSPESMATTPMSDQPTELMLKVDFPNHAALKFAAKTLSYDARYQAKHGNHSRAIESLIGVRKLAVLLNDDPSLIGMMVGVAIQAIAEQLAADLAFEMRGDSASINELIEIVKSEMPIRDFGKLLRYEYARGSTAMHDENQSVVEVPKTVVRRSALSIHTEYYLEQAKILAEETDSVVAQARIAKLTENMAPKLSSALGYDIKADLSMSLVIPLRARVRQAITIWAIEIERDYKGNWPKSLPSKVDNVLGGRLIYQKTENGFRVYSTGLNKRDEGGIPINEKDGYLTTDDIWLNHPPGSNLKRTLTAKERR